jgi:hypothetical protein
LENFFTQLLPNLAATFAGVLLALYVDGYLSRRRTRTLEAGLLLACEAALDKVARQREDVVTFLSTPTTALIPDFRLALLEGLVPRLAEVTTDPRLVSALDSLRQHLMVLDRGLSRSLDRAAVSGRPLTDADLLPLRRQFHEALEEANQAVYPALRRRLEELLPSRRRERERLLKRLGAG